MNQLRIVWHSPSQWWRVIRMDGSEAARFAKLSEAERYVLEHQESVA